MINEAIGKTKGENVEIKKLGEVKEINRNDENYKYMGEDGY